MEFSSESNPFFKVTWKIHNFTMIPYKAGEPLWSPTIVIDLFDGTEWNIGLYVRGYKNENYVTGIVYRGKSEKGDEIIPVGLEILFKNADCSTSLVYKKTFNFERNNGHGFQLVPHSEIFQEKKFLLPGDTLIMEFRMWRCIAEGPHTLQSCVRNWAFDSEFANEKAIDATKKVLRYDVSECRFRTRNNVEELVFIWAIPKFSTIKADQKLSVPICFVGKHSPKFVLSIKPNLSLKKPEESVHIELSADKEKSFYCSYDISLVDCGHVSRIHMKGEYFFEIGTSKSCSIPNSLKWSEIQRNKHSYLVDETLTLYCKFVVSDRSSINSSIEQTVYAWPKFGVLSLNNAGEEDETPNDPIMEHNRKRKFCDVLLHVEGKLLRTHKIILCNWSSVFTTILEQDLNEDGDILQIEDFDADTIDRMLLFMYAQTVEELNWKETANLYLAAEKYEIEQLRADCLGKLRSKISISNVCDLLSLAGMNENKELVRLSTGFIKKHKEEVLHTEEWEKLMESKGALAAQLMHEMFVKEILEKRL